MIRTSLIAVLAAVSALATAQDAAPDAVTTSAGSTSPRSAVTSGPSITRGLTPEMFERRWASEEQLYKEAGIPDEKIQKIKTINQKVWNARANGEKIDFHELNRERQAIFTEEETKKYRDLLQQRIPENLRGRDYRTSASAQAKATTATAE